MYIGTLKYNYIPTPERLLPQTSVTPKRLGQAVWRGWDLPAYCQCTFSRTFPVAPDDHLRYFLGWHRFSIAVCGGEGYREKGIIIIIVVIIIETWNPYYERTPRCPILASSYSYSLLRFVTFCYTRRLSTIILLRRIRTRIVCDRGVNVKIIIIKKYPLRPLVTKTGL